MLVAVPVVAVTVWFPSAVGAHSVAAQLAPSTVKPVTAVMSPRLLSAASKPVAVYVCDPPVVMVAVAGESTR